MARKKPKHCLEKIKTDTARAKLEIERIKLKTLAYELKTAADKKRKMAEAKANKQEMDTMEVVNKLMGDLVLSFQQDMFKARREAALLRRELATLQASHH